MTTNETVVEKHLVDSSKQETTFFSDEGAGIRDSPAAFDQSQVADLLHIEGIQDITSVLSRPIKIASGVFSTTDSTKLFQVDPFLSVVTFWATKLANTQLIRADVEVTIKVNAQRFDTGRYILMFIPAFGVELNSSQYKMHVASLTQYTQLQHVEVDLPSSSSATMTIPWRSVVPYYANQTTKSHLFSFGYIELRPYKALDQVNSLGNPGYTVFARLTNVRLAGPTVAQAGTEWEEKKAGIGPVSGFMSKVSRTAGILGELPVVGTYMNSLSWVSNVLGRAAKSAGWSKPPVLSAPNLIQPRHTAHIENVDGASTARQLGGFTTNLVEPIPDGVALVEDEMALSSIAQRFAYWNQFTWTTSNVAGDLLQTLQCVAWCPTTVGMGTVVPPVSYPLTMFSKWRGGLKYRVKIVKNEFYSGRLGVAFAPIEPGGTYTLNLTNLGVEYNRVIIDLRDRNEFQIVVPYSSVRNYLDRTQSFGALAFFVIDPLVTPDSCPSSITFLVEVAGAEDFEYADPKPVVYGPMVPYSVQSGQTFEEVLDCYCMGKASTPSLAVSKVAFGERFLSLRELPKKMCFPLANWYLNASANTRAVFAAFWLSVQYQSTSLATTPTSPTYFFDYYTQISALFGVVTGGVRVQFTLNHSETGIAHELCVEEGGTTTQAFVDSTYSYWAKAVVNKNSEPIMDMVVPSYQLYLGRPVASNIACTSATLAPPSYVGSCNKLAIVQSIYGDNLAQVLVTRQAHDDYNALYFFSTPVLY